MKKIFILLLSLSALIACRKAPATVQAETKQISVPAFNADSAYLYVKDQVDFGPRVPNTPEHKKCAAYLADKLRTFGAKVAEQQAVVVAFDGTKLNSVNIIGSYNPQAKTRVLLFAHWDSRPWSDNDPDPANHKKPVLGANDGASGVGVLLEMARQFSKQKPTIGVDIAFFDAEDYGAPSSVGGDTENSWCLGTQYWCSNPHVQGYQARYGILLDMVGAPGATFYKEQISMYYAPNIVEKVWNVAGKLGFGNYFVSEDGGAITDDHVFVNKMLQIPSIDIIHYRKNSEQGFGDYWHTINDTMENIDKNTLYAVGSTLLNVVYNEE
jgi:hypothetical protein